MPGFGLFERGLISVRSVVDLRLACGQSSVVSGRSRGLRLESSQAHSGNCFPRLIFRGRAGFFVSPYPTETVDSCRRFQVENPGLVGLGVLELAYSGNGKMPGFGVP